MFEFLKERDAVKLLQHAEAVTATTAISDRGGIFILHINHLILNPLCIGKNRGEVQQEIKSKERAVKRLIKQFSNDDLSEEDIEWCLYSLGSR